MMLIHRILLIHIDFKKPIVPITPEVLIPVAQSSLVSHIPHSALLIVIALPLKLPIKSILKGEIHTYELSF